jgi:DNA polymerase-3 subunit delta'
VRFDPPEIEDVAGAIHAEGVAAETALACARLALGDAERARTLAGQRGSVLRGAGERFARAALTGETGSVRPWTELLGAVRAQGDETRAELEGQAAAELELYPRKERKRIENEWEERIRRVRRRVETAALDLGLQVVSLWLRDLACIEWGAAELVAHADRSEALASCAGHDPQRLREAIELVEETRRRFQLNVSEELACEALAYRLESALG